VSQGQRPVILFINTTYVATQIGKLRDINGFIRYHEVTVNKTKILRKS
jgi:hypothetical protein